MLSIIIPCFNEEGNVAEAAEVLKDTLTSADIEYELVFIDDGSKDRTRQKVEELHATHPVSLYSFSRNFGKEAAIFCGLKHCTGDCAVIYDCDMQFPASTIVEMYRKWCEGYLVVEGIKKERQRESAIKKWGANGFYSLLKKSGKIDLRNATDFKLMDRKVIDTLNSMPERETFFRALSSWVGFTSCRIEFEVEDRKNGVSKWSFTSLVRYAITNLTSYTFLPLQATTVCGIIFLVLAMCTAIYLVYQLLMGQVINGYTLVVFTILMSSSILMIALGVIGLYLAKIYRELQQRPRFIVEKEVIRK
ncbi:MAG: glycosyltransferase family 2 protein [Erysipelotrichales bacterium]|nr:glycosyltransferase family 2 protein [Erysipelotrichales bacterium]